MTKRRQGELALKIEKLRAGFLPFTQAAFARLPALERPRVLDVGCGSGQPTVELARLGGGEVVGIDVDEEALSLARRRIEESGLRDMVEVVRASLLDAGFTGGSFDLLWAEGVLHVLDPEKSLPACRRLLKPGGFLVLGEMVDWFEGIRQRLGGFGFEEFDRLPLPRHCWWTDFYAPLEEYIKSNHDVLVASGDLRELARCQSEIAMVKADPGRFDCCFYLLRKRL